MYSNLPFVNDSICEFINARKEYIKDDQKRDKISIVEFSDNSKIVVPTTNLHLVQFPLNLKANGGTNFKSGFTGVKSVFDSRKKTDEIPCIIFLTDGKDPQHSYCHKIIKDMYDEQIKRVNALYFFTFPLGKDIDLNAL